MWTPHATHAPSDHLQIVLLAIAMGIQAVIGQAISLTTIVFTMTLTLVVRKMHEVVLLPFIGVALAFAIHRRSRRKAA